MPTVSLPQTPNLGQLKEQAKELQSAWRAGDAVALAQVAEHYPAALPGADGPGDLKLSTARNRHRPPLRLRELAQVEASCGTGRPLHPRPRSGRTVGRPPRGVPASGVSQLRRRRARTVGGGWPASGRGPRSVKVEHPPRRRPGRRRLGRPDPERRPDPGGPHGRTLPVGAVDLSGLRPPRSEDLRGGRLATARLLLAAGADPNAGYLWHGLPEPIHRPDRRVRRRRARSAPPAPTPPLATRSPACCWRQEPTPTTARRSTTGCSDLATITSNCSSSSDWAGATAALGGRDSETRSTHRPRWCGTSCSGPSSTTSARRVRLLADHGVDLRSPFDDGHTPSETALLNGNPAVADLLVSAGASPPELTASDAFVAAALQGDRGAVERMAPDVIDEVGARRPGLIVWAAANGRIGAVAVLARSASTSTRPAGRPSHRAALGDRPAPGRLSRRRGPGRAAGHPRCGPGQARHALPLDSPWVGPVLQPAGRR